MKKTYESIWHCPETDKDIIIARGDSVEYVRDIAQMNQFVPFKVREYQTPADVLTLYREWRKENGNKKPNRVIVKMHWQDDVNTEKDYQTDIIGIVPLWKIGDTEDIPDDDGILFYISKLDDLFALMEPNNYSDFIIDEVQEFCKVQG